MRSPSQIRRRLKALMQNGSLDFLAVGDCLYQLRDVDPGKFVEAARECGIGRRTAYYLADAAHRARGFLRYRQKLVKLGWTKAHVVLKAMTVENAAELLGIAEGATVQDLKGYVRRGEPSRAVCFSVYLTQREARELQRALLANGAEKSGAGLAKKQAALMRMVRAAMR